MHSVTLALSFRLGYLHYSFYSTIIFIIRATYSFLQEPTTIFDENKSSNDILESHLRIYLFLILLYQSLDLILNFTK